MIARMRPGSGDRLALMPGDIIRILTEFDRPDGRVLRSVALLVICLEAEGAARREGAGLPPSSMCTGSKFIPGPGKPDIKFGMFFTKCVCVCVCMCVCVCVCVCVCESNYRAAR